MNDVQNWLTAALVGTGRSHLPEASANPLGQALQQLQQHDPEATLLAAAALTGLAQQAGQVPLPLDTTPPPKAPPETLPETPLVFARHLDALSGGPILLEWLTLCAQGGWRVPFAALPALLDLARHDQAVRTALRPVLGERGAWLVPFNPEWRFFKGHSTPATLDEDAWAEATEAQKEALFRSLRAADPPGSRAWLQTHFKTERASSKKRLLNVIRETCTPEDVELEPLLETALSDRSEEVQELARQLLRRWPQSAFNTRMAQRLEVLVQSAPAGWLDRLRGQPEKFSLKLPDPLDQDVKRDGFETGLTGKGFLWHILKSAHPDALLDRLSLKPEDLVGLAKQQGALDELREGIVQAGHVALAQAILPHWSSHSEQSHQRAHRRLLRAVLIKLASQEQLEQGLAEALKQEDAEQIWLFLQELPQPWSLTISQQVLRLLRDQIKGIDHSKRWSNQWNPWASFVDAIRFHADPFVTRPEPLPEQAPDYARETLDELYHTLDLRAQLWRDFQSAQREA